LLALKNKVTSSALISEKKSLYRFLTLYVTMGVIAISILSIFYYQSQKSLMLAHMRSTLFKYAFIQAKRLKVLHHYFDERTKYPRDPRFKSAIYDLEYMEIFSLLEEKKVHFHEEIYMIADKIHFVKSIDDFYLGTKYIIIEVTDDGIWRKITWKNIIGYGLVFFFLFIFIVYVGLMSIFLTIIADAFATVKEDVGSQTNDYEIVDFMWKKIQGVMG